MDAWSRRRTERKVRALLADVDVDLAGMRVYTEAATGAYRITAAVALLAGARSVHCVARASRFGPAEGAIAQSREFAASLGLDLGRLGFSEGHSPEALAEADLVTNMGMLRPLDASVIGRMRPGSVIALMYEPWELRAGDVDLAAARARGVTVVGVNEDHPKSHCVGGISVLLLDALVDAGLAVFSDDLLLVCGSPFARRLVRELHPHCRSLDLLDDGAAGDVLPENVRRLHRAEVNARHYDALLLVDAPNRGVYSVADDPSAAWPRRCLGTWDACVESMGNVRRADFPGVRFRPEAAPPLGYMGTNPASLGPDMVARLVAAGLAAGAEALGVARRDPAALRAPGNPFVRGWALPLEPR
jgi:hypothetical protein